MYCEKPLTLTVQEARDIRRIAQQAGVATQMGNQGAATDAFREQVELLQTGGLGEVRDAYVGCRLSDPGIRPLPTAAEQVPNTLAWDLPITGTCPSDDQSTAALDREHREG